MTGYGRAEQLIDGWEITVEIRSVNHRFFEFSARLPRSMGYLEEMLKSTVYTRVSRGKIDLSLSVVSHEQAGTELVINHKLAGQYLTALRSLADELGLEDDVKLSSLARFGDIFSLCKAGIDEDALKAAVKTVAQAATERLMLARAAEGKRMRGDISDRLENISKLIEQLEERYPAVAEQYRERLLARLREVLQGGQIDEQRVLTEAAIFAEKTAVAEEVVRLGSHIAQFGGMLTAGQSVGRGLDFIVQEMNREVNTIGSKAHDAAISKIVVELKGEIEKIREQIQNIE